MVDFTANNNHDKVELRWQTASEQNNKGFHIERNSSGSNRWVELGFVAGHGTTNKEQGYSFLDENPLPGTSYYRLRQMDFDGGEEYSKMVSVDFRNLQGFGNLSIFPNPVHDGELNLYFGEMLDEGTAAEIHLFDALGRRVKTAFVENTKATSLSIDGLAPGSYLLEVAVGQQRFHQKIIVQ
ncbi:MAG: T9SS type A sorting domain-containing protein [Saprospiraceae bacterium]|nr:T9SS type A sorting domain-containing protein [Saprospiraceae bacterium]